MKKLLLLLLILPMSVFADNYKAADPSVCVSGVIKYIKYNDDDSMSVAVDKYELYTSRWNLEPFLVDAFYAGAPITIMTSSCYNGGGFASVKFDLYK